MSTEPEKPPTPPPVQAPQGTQHGQVQGKPPQASQNAVQGSQASSELGGGQQDRKVQSPVAKGNDQVTGAPTPITKLSGAVLKTTNRCPIECIGMNWKAGERFKFAGGTVIHVVGEALDNGHNRKILRLNEYIEADFAEGTNLEKVLT
jgi:hypothetical protein